MTNTVSENQFDYFAAFFVKHFSDTVEYDAFSFLEKNRDTVSKELVNVLRESEMDFLRKLMELDDCDDGKQNKSTSSLSGRVVISASKSLVRFTFVCLLFCIIETLIESLIEFSKIFSE